MPETPTALLILLIAVLPGAFGNIIFQAVLGINWREQVWQSLLRLLGFSTVGVVLYIVFAGLTGAPPPLYILPDTYKSGEFNASSLLPMAVAYVGHCIASAVAGVLGVTGYRVLSIFAPASPYAYAWDDFLRNYVPGHWVAVTLVQGDSYAGILGHADTAATHDGRDLILREPARYDPATKNYIALPYQSLFLPGRLVASIAVVSEPSIDKRLTVIGESVFSGGTSSESR